MNRATLVGGMLATMNRTTLRMWHKKAARRRLDLFAVINGDLSIDVGRHRPASITRSRNYSC